MKKGDIVKVTGGYFKNDNGTYRVEHAPGDDDWSGKDWCLYRLNKNGTLSEGKDHITFWPLIPFVNSYQKRCEARTHNAEHAAIEVIKST